MEPLTTYLVKQTEVAIRAHLDAALRDHGLTAMQYTALTVLQHRGDLSSAQLARRSFVRPQTMHEMVTGLERQGLIERHPSPDHTRVLLIRLTDEGRTTLAECAGDVEKIERRMVAPLTPDELTTLRCALERCFAALSAP